MDENVKNLDFEQLKLLFDLTKFHGTIYMSAIGLIAGVVGSKQTILSYNRGLLCCALIFMLITSFAAAILLKSICGAHAYSEFWNTPIGPGELKLLTAKMWAYLERTCFWIATVLALLAFWLGSGRTE